ncbi:MAG TPA: amino acid permease [bacterium]|nr:amino acid permease [bacterium]
MKQKIERVLSARQAAALGIGIVIGTGIFAVPGFVALELQSPGPILLAWVFGGLIALSGALTHAEIAGMVPRQGGSFIFVLEAFGPWAAFFKGWGAFLIGYPASSAAIATVLGIYLARLVAVPDSWVKPFALAACVLVWLFNLRGTRFSGSFQTAITFSKVAALGLLALVGFLAGGGSFSRLLVTPETMPGIDAFAIAMIGILWTFDGWQNLTVVSGEVGMPEKSLTRSLLLTIALVTAIYLLMNICYLTVLPIEELRGAEAPATRMAERAFGVAGGKVVSALVVLSSFGALFGISMAAPRYFYALGESGLFFRQAAAIDPVTQAPRWGTTAILITTAICILTGTFEQIISYYICISLVYNMLAVGAVYRLRSMRPDAPRPFRIPGYPVTPAVFILASLGITASEVARAPARSAIAFAVLLAALPAYHLWRREAHA